MCVFCEKASGDPLDGISGYKQVNSNRDHRCRPVKILLLSPYDAPSHRYWCKGLIAQFDDCQWTYLSLAPRHFSWRIRGNSLTWAFSEREALSCHYDLLIATSMTDLSALRGFIPRLSACPTLLYFHENQFAYPKNAQQYASVEAQIVSIYAALCADKLIFNSAYNRQTFLAGVGQLLAKLPDGVPKQLVPLLTSRSQVLPVPLNPIAATFDPLEHSSPLEHSRELHILWNHRWEYDKGPERLLSLVESLPEHVPLRFHILGQQFRVKPPAFTQLHQVLSHRGWLASWGYESSDSHYRQLLRHCDLVLSTAHHDFQGLSVQEAVLSGCIPLVPDQLAYPEWFAAEYQYPEQQLAIACDKILHYSQLKRQGSLPAAPGLQHLLWPQLRGAYWQIFQDTLASVVPRHKLPGRT